MVPLNPNELNRPRHYHVGAMSVPSHLHSHPQVISDGKWNVPGTWMLKRDATCTFNLRVCYCSPLRFRSCRSGKDQPPQLRVDGDNSRLQCRDLERFQTCCWCTRLQMTHIRLERLALHVISISRTLSVVKFIMFWDTKGANCRTNLITQDTYWQHNKS